MAAVLRARLAQLGPGCPVPDTNIDWLWSAPITRPLLDWLSLRLNPSNVLTDEELSTFAELTTEAPDSILHGVHLEAELRALGLYDQGGAGQGNVSAGDLEQQVADLVAEEVEPSRERLLQCTRERDALLANIADTNRRADALERHGHGGGSASGRGGGEGQAFAGAASPDFEELESAWLEALDGVSQSVVALAPGDESKAAPKYLSMAEEQFRQFEEANRAYALATDKLVDRQFNNGIGALVRGDDAPEDGDASSSSRYALLDPVSDDSSLLIRGDSAHVYRECCAELKRLQACYELSQTDRLEAAMTEAVARFMLDRQTDKQLQAQQAHHHHLHSHHQHHGGGGGGGGGGGRGGGFGASSRQTDNPGVSSAAELRVLKTERIPALQRRVAQVSAELRKLWTGAVPPLLADLAGLQSSYILSGDYSLKIARQEYYLSRQDTVLSRLWSQRSWCQCLHGLLSTEEARVQAAVDGLTALTCEVAAVGKGCDTRIAYYDQMKLPPPPPPFLSSDQAQAARGREEEEEGAEELQFGSVGGTGLGEERAAASGGKVGNGNGGGGSRPLRLLQGDTAAADLRSLLALTMVEAKAFAAAIPAKHGSGSAGLAAAGTGGGAGGGGSGGGGGGGDSNETGLPGPSYASVAGLAASISKAVATGCARQAGESAAAAQRTVEKGRKVKVLAELWATGDDGGVDAGRRRRRRGWESKLSGGDGADDGLWLGDAGNNVGASLKTTLSTPGLSNAMHSLSADMDSMTARIASVDRARSAYKAKLSSADHTASVLQTERELFCHFYNSPESLTAVVDESVERLEAHSIGAF